MKIKNIIYKGPVNLSNCESEPIHIPGSIQPHGAMLGLAADYEIVYCSENTIDFFDLAPEELLGKPVETIIGQQEQQRLRQYTDALTAGQEYPFQMHFNGHDFDVTVHWSHETLILEFEHATQSDFDSGINFYLHTRNFVRNMEVARNMRQLCQSVANEVRDITGYDRVMIYKFDPDYNGEVYAEARREDLEPFLGLHYPHTDIPAQARALYLKNLLRIIADVNYTPAPLLTIDRPGAKTQLDLGGAVLRSVSPIHLEYLRNMGVAATLTISLIDEGRLWGLIACHHYSPKPLPYIARYAARLQGYFLTSQLAVRATADEYECTTEVNHILSDLNNRIAAGDDYIGAFEKDDRILRLTHSQGAAIILQGMYYAIGETPAYEQVRKLIQYLSGHIRSQYYYTSNLAREYAPAKEFCDTGAGVLFHSLGDPLENCVIWFRPEKEKIIHWAGNPHKAVVADGDKTRLSPRKSFALWKEAVRFHSLEWRECEINAGVRLAVSIQNQTYIQNLKEEEKKYRELSVRLQLANEQLEHFNWITSHDLKEPLRMISIYSEKVRQDLQIDRHHDVSYALQVIHDGVNRMNNLITAILEYNKVGTQNIRFRKTDLREMLSRIVKNLEPRTEETGARIHTGHVPEYIMCIPVLIEQLFQNLVQNAIKFRRPGVAPEIIISAIQMNDVYEFTVADNGIGIDPQYAEKVFQVFQRINLREEYEGSGVGLAICKRIIQVHGGSIWVQSELNHGAVFHFTIPKDGLTL